MTTLNYPTSPHLTPVEMPQLIDWLNERIREKDLVYLVNEKLILKTGERRGTRYHIASKVEF